MKNQIPTADQENGTRTDGSNSAKPVRSDSEAAETIRRLKQLAKLMDASIRIPFTRRHMGLDSLIGLIPGIGDAATAIISAEFVRQAIRLGARKRVIARMIGNVGADMLIGAIPVLGDLFDVAFKANTKNAALLEEEILNAKTVEGVVLRSKNNLGPISKR